MTTTTYLEIPHLEQNVAQPEVPVNEAEDILDAAIRGVLAIDMAPDTNYTLDDTSLTYPQEWQYGIIKINAAVHTATRDLIIPSGKYGKYAIHNNSGTQPIRVIATGLSVTVPNGVVYQVYCDGTDVFRIQ